MLRKSHEIDYVLYGDDMQVVEITLDPRESVIAEAGNFISMEEGIELETIFGDGSPKNESFGAKLLGAGKRLLTGESLFLTAFTNNHPGERKKVSFAAPYPGKVLPVDLREYQGELICQKDAFLCGAKGVGLSIALTKRVGAAFFGGEGFILQKLEGDGLAFLHAGGTLGATHLKAGERLRVDSGCLVAMTKDIDFDVELVGGVKTALFGGHGLFLTTVCGPGTVWLQSLPFNRLASRVFAAAPTTNGSESGDGVGATLVGTGFNMLFNNKDD